MSDIKVKSMDDDLMQITIGKEVHALRLRDFDEIVLKIFTEQKRHYEEVLVSANDYKTTQNAMISVRVLAETLEKITQALFIKCLSETYNHYQTEVNEEMNINNFSELLDALGIKEG